jgi:excisionase family DNA binding protein
MITIENSKYYTIQELATSLKVTPQTVRAWIKQDKLIGKKVGKRILIREDKIIEFLNANS